MGYEALMREVEPVIKPLTPEAAEDAHKKPVVMPGVFH